MMSVTNKSRVLALVLAIAMVLSLVPVMATAASGKDTMGYANITYPATNDTTNYNYTISTVYYGANGEKGNGDVAVKISPDGSTNINDILYYNVFNVVNGKLEFTVSLADADPLNPNPEGKYNVEFITGNMDDAKNDAYFYFYRNVAAAEAAREADLMNATSFDSVAIQQKLLTLNGLNLYNKYIVNNTNEKLNDAYISAAAAKLSGLNPLYTNDAAFVKAVEEATVVALFDAVTNRTYFNELLIDREILNVIAASNVSPDFNEARNLLYNVPAEDFMSTINDVVSELAKNNTIFDSFNSLALTANALQIAINAAVEEDDQENIKENIGNVPPSGVGSGPSGPSPAPGGTYVPPVPSNPVIHVSNVFTDLNANYWWVINPLQTLYTKGYINGRTATTFAPGENITRAEFLKILLLELNMVDTNATVSFADVNASDWFYPYVASGANRGIVKGRTETEFAPNAQITREEICIMTMRAVRALNIDLGYNSVSGIFTDEAEIADYAVEDVHALKAAGIVSGRDTGAFDPKANATRAEAVKILYGVYEKQ